jgi:hypothetical protein
MPAWRTRPRCGAHTGAAGERRGRAGRRELRERRPEDRDRARYQENVTDVITLLTVESIDGDLNIDESNGSGFVAPALDNISGRLQAEYAENLVASERDRGSRELAHDQLYGRQLLDVV